MRAAWKVRAAVPAALGLMSLGLNACGAPLLAESTATGCEHASLMARWHKPSQSVAAAPSGGLDAPLLMTEQPYRVQLAPCDSPGAAGSRELQFECRVGSYVAAVRFTVPRDGRYRVAVDAPVWIDWLSNGRKVDGLMCEHSGCLPVRKMVQFESEAGEHWLRFEFKQPIGVGFLVNRVDQ